MPMTLHRVNGLPYGTVKRAPAPSFAHAVLLDQHEDVQCWHVVDLYGPMPGLLTDAEVQDWPTVYTPIEDDEWEKDDRP